MRRVSGRPVRIQVLEVWEAGDKKPEICGADSMPDSGGASLTKNLGLCRAVIFLGTMILYLLMPTKGYYWDGVYFALRIEQAGPLQPHLVHPNHLVYEVAAYLAYSGARPIGLSLRAIEVMQIANSVLGALGNLLVYSVLINTTRSLYISCALSSLFAFSVSWWKFSTDADSYVPSVVLMLLAFYVFVRSAQPRPLLVGAVHAAAMMFHQLAVFLYPTLSLGLTLQTSPPTAAKRFWVLLQYTATAGLLTVSAYWCGFIASGGVHDLRHLLRWVTSSSPDAHFSFNLWSNLVRTLRGHVQLIFGGRISNLESFTSPGILFLTLLLFTLGATLVVRLVRHRSELETLVRAAVSYEDRLSRLWKLSLV